MSLPTFSTGSSAMDAQRAFEQAARARRRAAVACRLGRRDSLARCGLPVHDETSLRRAGRATGATVRSIPVDAITGTVEPNRARQFDTAFRPAALARARWERVWLAEDRGIALPPIRVVGTRNGYAVRDGHHRVSVAKARGAATIDAVVERE